MLISKLTTFQNKGKVKTLVCIKSLETLVQLIRKLSENKKSPELTKQKKRQNDAEKNDKDSVIDDPVINNAETFLMIGKGSNSLIDPNSETVFIRLEGNLSQCYLSENSIIAFAGCTISKLLRYCVKHKINGFDFMAGVPASIGGMTFMNFGCWGESMSQIIEEVQYMDRQGNLYWEKVNKLSFGYRKSIFQTKPWIITAVKMRYEKAKSSKEVQDKIDQRIKQRLDHQPISAKTFGSIFKNHEKIKAAKLIEEMRTKLNLFKTVKISQKHANFMENIDSASYQEVTDLIHQIKELANKKHQVNLECEVRFLS